MANIKSQMKRIKTNEKARQRNKAVKSALRTHVRRFGEAVDAGDAEKAQEIRDENPEGFAARRRIEAAKRAESLISGQMRTIERDRAMTGEEKRARLGQLEKRRDEIARRALLVPAAAGRD